jgi:hypothetical protein
MAAWLGELRAKVERDDELAVDDGDVVHAEREAELRGACSAVIQAEAEIECAACSEAILAKFTLIRKGRCGLCEGA